MCFYERFAVAGGQYWQARVDIPEIEATSTLYSRGRVETDGREAVSAGTVLLVKSLRYIDGDLHTVILAPHPLEGKEASERRFLQQDFFDLFEYAHDAVEVRSREIAGVENEISQLRMEMMAGPPDLPKLSAPTRGINIGTMVANADRAEEIRQNAVQIHEIAHKRAVFVQERNERLGERAGILALFHQEQATAALAAVEDTLQMAARLQSGVQTLGLYTGEDVTAKLLCDGEEAPADSPLTLYQRKLFVDEEWGIHVLDGGADTSDLSEFTEALATDPTLLARLLPAPRSVVLMAFRREDKIYFDADPDDPKSAMAAAIANSAMNESKGNKHGFLLIRNGQKIWKVDSELATKGAIRLFPTAEDVAAIYKTGGDRWRGVDATQMTANDLRYTDRREKHDELALFYKRLLVLLWGLNDRKGAFGTFYDPATWPSWLSLDFQQRHFQFIYDDENVLTDERYPELDEFVLKANRQIQPGSRVVAVWNKIMTSVSAPGAVKRSKVALYDDRDWFAWHPLSHSGFAIVANRGGENVISTKCKKNTGAVVDAKISLTALIEDGTRLGLGTGVLCLDTVRAEDIDHYIQSRKHRSSYLRYLPLFIAARDQLRKEELQARPFLTSVRTALQAGGFPLDEKTEEAIATAIRLWRAESYGAAVPEPNDKNYRKVLKQVGRILYAILGRIAIDGDRLQTALAETGRTPLRLAMDRTGTFVVYATPTDAETLNLGYPHPWAARMPISDEASLTFDDPSWCVLRPSFPAETGLIEWPEAADWIDRPLPETKTWFAEETPRTRAYSEFALLRDRIEAGIPIVRPLLEGVPLSDDDVQRWMRLMNDIRQSWKSEMVLEPDIVFPVALVAVDRRDQKFIKEYPNRVFTPHLRVMCLHVPFLDVIKSSSERGLQHVLKWVARSYARPPSHIERHSNERGPKLAFSEVHHSHLDKFFDDQGLTQRFNRGTSLTGVTDLSSLVGRFVQTNEDRRREPPKVEVLYAHPEADALIEAAVARWGVWEPKLSW